MASTDVNVLGATCKGHDGKAQVAYKPAAAVKTEWVTVVALCDKAQALGKSRGAAVRLCGGDGGYKPAFAPEFTVYTMGGRKYVDAKALTSMEQIFAGTYKPAAK
jgi:hypothetical protein